jgi:hypothetical protein
MRDDLRAIEDCLGANLWKEFLKDIKRIYRSNRTIEALRSGRRYFRDVIARLFPTSALKNYEKFVPQLFEKW